MLMIVLLVCAVMGAAYLLTIIWTAFATTAVPSFLLGLVGGASSLPVWLGLKKLRDSEPKRRKKDPRR